MWLWLSNGTLQIHWFGTKFGTYERDEIIIFCPKMDAVTLVMPDNSIKTYKCPLLNEGRGPTRYVMTKFMRFRNISRISRYFTCGWLRYGILSGSRTFSKNSGDFKSPGSGFFSLDRDDNIDIIKQIANGSRQNELCDHLCEISSISPVLG